MAFSVKIELDKRNSKKDGKYPLKLLVVVKREPLRLPLGYSLLEKDWNEKLQSIRASCKEFDNVSRINNWLLKEKSKILGKLSILREDGVIERLSLMEIKNLLIRANDETLTLEFFNETIKELEMSKRFGNARVYDTTARSIKNFVKGNDFPLKQISFAWLKKYETWYLSKGNTLNGLSVHIRTLRSLYNKAIKLKKISSEYYPFKDFTLKKEETRKRAINRDELIRFLQYEPKTDRHKRAKDYFLISFYLMGASFVDIALLKLRNIIKDRIEYKRQKTGKLHSIPIANPLMEILNKYLLKKGENDFILNITHSTEPKKQLIEIRDELRRYNRSLKEISTECGIESKISSYVARHSYATNAKRIGVPTAIISEALGHTTEKTTQVYLDSFDNTVVDSYHDLIINLTL